MINEWKKKGPEWGHLLGNSHQEMRTAIIDK